MCSAWHSASHLNDIEPQKVLRISLILKGQYPFLKEATSPATLVRRLNYLPQHHLSEIKLLVSSSSIALVR